MVIMEKNIIINNSAVSKIVFYPRKTIIPNDLESWIEVLKFKIDKNITIGGFLYRKDLNLPTIILFHGNGEVAFDYKSIAPLYFECDLNLAVLDFRGYGFSTGEPYYTSLITDALPLYTKFEEWALDNEYFNSFFVQGRSMGSVCAAEIGSHNPKNLKGIIFESGFASVYNMMTRLFRVSSPELTPKTLSEYSNDIRVRKFRLPTLIIHGTSDFIIPIDEGKLLFENLPNDIDKSLIAIKGAGHNNILMYKDEYFDPISNFVSKYK
jgi:pimeloyl-ACP methyl ester carboxylesterase